MAVTSTMDMSMAIVSEISTEAGTKVDRLRLLNFQYTYSDGGDVSNVTTLVTTLTATPYTANNAFLYTQFGGVSFAPNAGLAGSSASGAFFVGSYDIDVMKPSINSGNVGAYASGFPLVRHMYAYVCICICMYINVMKASINSCNVDSYGLGFPLV